MFARAVLKNCLKLSALFIVLAGTMQTASAQLEDEDSYTDRIHLKNGDVITGNIKQLDRGKLRFKTRTMDTVFINWVDIESIESDKYFRFVRVDGSFNNGVIRNADLDEGLIVDDNGREVSVPIPTVAAIQPIRVKQSFWRRLEGEVTAGIDFKKASDILLVNLSSAVRLKEEKYEISFGANWNETSRTENNDTSRADLSSTYTRFLRNRWFWKASAGFESNEELGLDLRGLVGATAGKYLVQKPTWRWELNAGLAGNWEQRQDGETASTEGLIRSSLDIFNYAIPITRFSAHINVFPGITDSGRLRVNTDITMRNEIVRSVFWDLTFYSTYDNRPPEGASRQDFGIGTSLGASF